MSWVKGGYMGRILWINLSNRKIAKRPLSKKLAMDYLGMRGFGSKILWDEVYSKIAPLSPENILVFSIGPLTSTLAPSSGRWTVTSKSPLTGLLGYANAGGHWGPELKYAGYDAMVIFGRAKKPVYLWIDDEHIKIKDASQLWGRDTRETDAMIKEEIGNYDLKVASIGPAGENLVKIASVMAMGHAAARTGMGAVMGSKQLKAIAVHGTKGVMVVDPQKFIKAREEVLDNMLEDEVSGGLAPKFGTTMWLSAANEMGALGTRNFQTGIFEWADRISGEALRDEFITKAIACFGCPLRCDRYSVVDRGPFSGTWVNSGPEYATLHNQGSRVGIRDLSAIIKANELCNRYGLDTYSVGGVIGLAMECYEKGILMKEDLDGLEVEWGNISAHLDLIRKIAYREGIGDVLAEGVNRAAGKIGKGAEKYAIHVKGMAYPSMDPRAAKGYGFGCLVSNRGADHLYALCSTEFFTPDQAEKLFGAREASNPMDAAGKGKMVMWFERVSAIVDMMGVCKIAYNCYVKNMDSIVVRTFKGLPKMYSAITGIKITEEKIITAADRLVNLERAYNMRERQFTRKDDCFPERFLNEPLPEGPAKGQIFEQEMMLDEYYEAREWDVKLGIPTIQKLEKLSLTNVIGELEQLKRFPHQYKEGTED